MESSSNHSKGIFLDKGIFPSVVITSESEVIEVHRSEVFRVLYSRMGKLENGTITWQQSQEYETGRFPCLAVNASREVVEAHQSAKNDSIWFYFGTLVFPYIDWQKSTEIVKYAKFPSISLNNTGVVVVAYETSRNSKICYKTGMIVKGTVVFQDTQQLDAGSSPSISLNNQGGVITFYESPNSDVILFKSGMLKSSGEEQFVIRWSFVEKLPFPGKRPKVVLADDYTVFCSIHSQHQILLNIGMLDPAKGKIEWKSKEIFDNAEVCSLAVNEKLQAVQIWQLDSQNHIFFRSGRYDPNVFSFVNV